VAAAGGGGGSSRRRRRHTTTHNNKKQTQQHITIKPNEIFLYQQTARQQDSKTVKTARQQANSQTTSSTFRSLAPFCASIRLTPHHSFALHIF
jgi:hypothetical protein